MDKGPPAVEKETGKRPMIEREPPSVGSVKTEPSSTDVDRDEARRVRRNASARAERRVDSGKGLQSIITELMVSNETLGRIGVAVNSLIGTTQAGFKEATRLQSRLVANSTDVSILLEDIGGSLKLLLDDIRWIRGKSNQIADYTDEMVDSINSLNKFFSTGRLQAAEDRREFLALIRSLRDGSGLTRSGPVRRRDAAQPIKTMDLADAAVGATLLGKIAKGIGGAGAAAAGLGAGFVTGILAGIKDLFGGIVRGLASIVKRGVGIDRIAALEGGIQRAILPVRAFFRLVSVKLEPITKLLKVSGGKIGEWTRNIFVGFEDMFGWLGKIARPFFKIGKLLGKLAVPLTVLMSAYDSIKAAIESYQRGGSIGDILKDSVTALLSSVVAAPLDLVKNAAAWIIGKLGGTSIAEALSGWDFSDWFSEIIDRVVNWGRNTIFSVISHVMEAATNIVEGFKKEGALGGTINLLEKLVHYILTVPIKAVIDGVQKVLERVPLFGKEASKWIRENIDVEKMLGSSGIEFSKEKPFRGKYEGRGLVDAVVARHDDRVEEEKKSSERIPKKKKIIAGQLSPVEEITALSRDTEDKKTAAEMALIAVPMGSARGQTTQNISNSASSIVYNASPLLDRTDMLMRPAWALQ